MRTTAEHARMTLDMRANRIRVHRSTLHALGDPNYIQFLVNPEECYIAVLGLSHPLASGTANKIRLPVDKAQGKHSIEFSSAALLNSIFDMIGDLDKAQNYKLTGEIDVENRVAYFSLKTLQPIERRSYNARKSVLEAGD